MNQIVLGMSVPLLICAAFYIARGGHATWRMLIAMPLALLLGGAWAVVPDFPRLWGALQFYNDLHHHPHCWIWFNHCRIDLVEIDTPLWVMLFLSIGLATIYSAWRELARIERQQP